MALTPDAVVEVSLVNVSKGFALAKAEQLPA